eukprot:6343004-Pyramimonas_sp.AAC.1
MLAAIAAGGAVEVTTCGEAGLLFTSVPTWVTILLPADADIRAAARGADRPQARLKLQLAAGPIH